MRWYEIRWYHFLFWNNTIHVSKPSPCNFSSLSIFLHIERVPPEVRDVVAEIVGMEDLVDVRKPKLGGWEDAGPVDDWMVVSNISDFSPLPGEDSHFDSYFFKWAETTN